jgi:hypothetical protein
VLETIISHSLRGRLDTSSHQDDPTVVIEALKQQVVRFRALSPKRNFDYEGLGSETGEPSTTKPVTPQVCENSEHYVSTSALKYQDRYVKFVEASGCQPME